MRCIEKHYRARRPSWYLLWKIRRKRRGFPHHIGRVWLRRFLKWQQTKTEGKKTESLDKKVVQLYTMKTSCLLLRHICMFSWTCWHLFLVIVLPTCLPVFQPVIPLICPTCILMSLDPVCLPFLCQVVLHYSVLGLAHCQLFEELWILSHRCIFWCPTCWPLFFGNVKCGNISRSKGLSTLVLHTAQRFCGSFMSGKTGEQQPATSHCEHIIISKNVKGLQLLSAVLLWAALN